MQCKRPGGAISLCLKGKINPIHWRTQLRSMLKELEQ